MLTVFACFLAILIALAAAKLVFSMVALVVRAIIGALVWATSVLGFVLAIACVFFLLVAIFG